MNAMLYELWDTENSSCLVLQLHFEVRTTFLGAADRRRGRIRTALTTAQLAKCNCRISASFLKYGANRRPHMYYSRSLIA